MVLAWHLLKLTEFNMMFHLLLSYPRYVQIHKKVSSAIEKEMRVSMDTTVTKIQNLINQGWGLDGN